jgi:putative chitinase
MNLSNFFASIRTSLFSGELSQSQVDGINAILAAWTKHNGTDQRRLAYVLGTVYHEAGKGFVPVREGFAHTNEAAIADVTAMFNRKQISKNYASPDPANGQSYYGRGFVQITWK